MKKLAVLLAMVMLMTSTLSAHAGIIEGHLSGPVEYVLESEYVTEANKASAYETELEHEEGGKATYNFYIPFDTESVSLNSENDLSGVLIEFDGTVVEITEKTDDVSTVVFPKVVRM